MPDYAGKVDSTAAIDVQFRTTDDLRIRLWKSKTRKNFINMYKQRSIRVARQKKQYVKTTVTPEIISVKEEEKSVATSINCISQHRRRYYLQRARVVSFISPLSLNLLTSSFAVQPFDLVRLSVSSFFFFSKAGKHEFISPFSWHALWAVFELEIQIKPLQTSEK